MRFVCGWFLIALLSAARSNSQIRTVVDPQTLRELQAAQQRLKASPDSEVNLLALASLYLKAGQNGSAISALQAYLQTHPDAPKTLRLLALAYLRQENYSAAKEASEQALRLSPRDSAGVQVLGMAELGLQASDAAEKLFREALQLNPDSAETNFQLGLLYTNAHKDLPEAIRLLEKARTLQPDLAPAYTALGSAFLAAGNAKSAADSLTTAVKLNPNSAESYYLLAQAYRQLHDDGKSDAALAEFTARKNADSDARAREMRSRADYEAGVNLLSNTDQLDKAYGLFANAVKELPTFDLGYYRMAQTSYLKGDLPSAVTSIHQALALNPFEPEYYFVLARCLENSDPRAALIAVEKAVSFRPGVPDFEELQRDLIAKIR